MAARGLVMPPFNFRIRIMFPSPHLVFLPWGSSRKVSPVKRSTYRCFCSQIHALPEIINVSEYRDKFAKRMAMAGLKPHHRIAMAVSGGPDSVALCILTADWKTANWDAPNNRSHNSIDGLLAIVVDHGLRTESSEEAKLVHDRVIDMGIKCEVARCEWYDGRPQLGHLQEEARNKRYEILQNICFKEQIGVLLVAHHSDDQAELFILRLSRNSGVLGLAGMGFSTQIFANFPNFDGDGSKAHGVLLVRPLLDFSKEDMYNICQCGHQQWVEDPTNKSQLYTRNRIRTSLSNLSSSLFKAELQAVISACRKTRLYVEECCHRLINQAVTTMHHGYTIIDLEIIHSTKVEDIVLAKFVTLVLQFVSQRQRPVRGNALKLLLDYLSTYPCKASLTVASCYLCPAPGSKGTKVLVCCSILSSLPLKMELFSPNSCEGHNSSTKNELKQILGDSKAHLNKFVSGASKPPFLNATSLESILIEAKRIKLLSESSHKSISCLQKEESELFKSKSETISILEPVDVIASGSLGKLIYPGKIGYFMDRFLINWEPLDKTQCSGCSCIIGEEMVAEVRPVIDADWIYLFDLSKKKTNNGVSQMVLCLEHAVLSANKALASLKSIPVAARRALPALVNSKGILLSIPSIGFTHCPGLMVSVVFNPRIPLGGGHTSFL